MYVVDASVWVSRFVAADSVHVPSRRWLEQRTDSGDLVAAPALVLAEVAGAVARRTGRSELGSQAMSLVQRLPNIRLVPLDIKLAQLSAKAAADLHIRGADAVYVAVAARLGIPLVTWDLEQLARGKATVDVLTPQHALSR